MQRKRGGLVPIGEASPADLPGPVQAIRDAPPPALHGHFTRFDQVNQLVRASEADPDLGFMARHNGAVLPAAQQPRQPPSVQARQRPVHALHERGRRQQAALRQPAAPVAGLGLTEAVRTQSRELVLGRSLSEFMRTLDIYSNSGRVHTRLRNQMKRLFGCTVSMVLRGTCAALCGVSSLVADKHEFWWNERKPDEPTLWESKIRLGRESSLTRSSTTPYRST